MADRDAPLPEIEGPAAEPRSRRVSAVWLVPLLALLIALGLAWQTWSSRGPLIEIVFTDASGLTAGQTPVRFRDVTVGVVEKIELNADLTRVIVRARIDKDVAHFLDDQAQFWIVRASITPQGVSGLDTVVSGAYIGAAWDNVPGEPRYSFEGLARPPLTPAGTPGLHVLLRSPDGGSMSVGAPVLFKRLQVGKIEDISLTEAGDVMLDIFVNAPNDKRLTDATRFWNASGFSVELGGGGATLSVDSLVSLIQGGVAFDTIGSDLTPVGENHVFQLYASETAARQNLIEDVPGNSLVLDVDFNQSVRGLSPGAQVQFQGIPVGEVTGVQGVSSVVDGRLTLRQRVTISIVPERFGQPPVPEGSEARTVALDYIEARVKDGLRAELASQGLLSHTLYVNLVKLPDAPPATFDRNAEPYPLLPAAPPSPDSITASAASFMDRIASLPIEAVVQNAVELLSNLNAIVTDPKVRSAPENLGALVADLRSTLDESGIREAPAQIAGILAAVKTTVDQMNAAQLVQSLSDVLATTKTAVASVGTAADGVPALIAQVDALAGNVKELPLDQLVASATRLVDGLDTFVRSDEVASLPASVAVALADLRGVVEELKAGGAVTNLNASLASFRQISDDLAAAKLAETMQRVLAEAETTVNTAGTAMSGLPKLIDSLAGFSENARALPLGELVARADGVLASADALLTSDGVKAAPAQLAAAIEDLRGVLGELRSGGAVDNLNATLASARQLADQLAAARIAESLQTVIDQTKAASANVADATHGLPPLIASLQAIADNARSLPLAEVVASLDGTLGAADALLRSEGVTSLPPKLGAAVEDLRGILAEVRSGDTVGKLNSTLASTDQAAAALAEGLPGLVARFTEVADRADAALATVAPGSEINRQTIQMLQELRDAARSANQLATTLQRRPNSIIFGR